MKRILLGALLAVASSSVLAEAPGGPGCGWGNMLFKGQKGLPSHMVASTTNASSGNATFGMTSGTNGCRTDGTLTYEGKPMLVVSTMMDELSEDMAKGEGEALTTYAVVLGVPLEDRAHFKSVTNQHFSEIFSSADVTAEQVLESTLNVMKRDETLARYVRS